MRDANRDESGKKMEAIIWQFRKGISICLLLLGLASAGSTELGATDVQPADESRFLGHVRQLTFEGKRSGEGYFSEDGKELIFQSEREPGNPFYQIYLLEFASGDIHRVSTGLGKTTCAFIRPNSDEVLFSSSHLDPEARAKQQAELDFRAAGKERRYAWDYDEHMDIFSARRDGSQIRRLTQARGYDAEGSYSPDGKKIVFCSLRDAYPTNKLSAEDLKRFQTDPSWFGEIYIMNADGSKQQRLTHSPGYDGGPFFSPDGRRIIWRRFDDKGTTADVYTMAIDGSDARRLTDFGSMSWAPFYHPSGKYVIFTSNKLGFSNFELYLVDADGTHEPVRVTFTDGFDGLPVFSPDGNRLCWTSGRTSDGKSQLFLADWNDQGALAAVKAAPARTSSATPTPAREKLAAAVPAPVSTQSGGEISLERLRGEVTYLACDALDGRMTGTKGAQLAADYIAGQLRQAGLRPMGDGGSYYQDFEFNSGVRIVTNQNHFVISPAQKPPPEWEVEKDFRPLSFTANGGATGEVVFAGYGLFVPGKAGEGYDSYAGLDVTNKIVLALRYVPEDVAPKRRQELNRYAGLRYKAMMARERGAKAVLIVSGPNSPNAGELAGLSFDTSLAGSGIVALTISSNVAAAILSSSGKDLKKLQTALDSENPHAEGGFVVSNLQVTIDASVEHLKKTDRNVIAGLPPVGKGPAEYVIVGAHYDHLGHGETGGMQRQGEEGQIHHGADDNASGAAVVLELASAFAKERARNPKAFPRGLIFALWSGEEIGLIGSSFFVEHPVVPLSKIAAYVNFDMVGRLNDNKLILQGAGSSTTWRRLAEKRNVAAGFNLVLQDDPYLPTDVTPFYPKQVPVLNFFTGSHEDYHRPTDTAERLNYEGMERIAQMARGMIADLVKNPERPEYAKVQQSAPGPGSRDNLRAYLGTIPDYTAEVAGVKLSGVRGGSPAEKSGLKGGDVIVGFGGQKIANIYDYTYALDAAKIGQPVALEIVRDGKQQTLTVTPEARK